MSKYRYKNIIYNNVFLMIALIVLLCMGLNSPMELLLSLLFLLLSMMTVYLTIKEMSDRIDELEKKVDFREKINDHCQGQLASKPE